MRVRRAELFGEVFWKVKSGPTEEWMKGVQLVKGSGDAQGGQWLAEVASNVKDLLSPGF